MLLGIGVLGSVLSNGIIFLAGAVDGNLDRDLASLDLLLVHLVDGLLLESFGAKGHEAEATTLAGLVAGLELLDHEAGDRPQGDLGGYRLVSSEKFFEL